MTLDRQLLTDMAISDENIDRILSAHQRAVDDLTAAAEQRESEAAALRTEYETYRAAVEAERLSTQRRSAIEAALTRAGANSQMVSLLAMAIETSDEDWDGGALRDEDAALAPVRERYSALFSTPTPLPTDPVSPPLDGGAFTLDDVRRMSETDINRNWPYLSAALTQR